MKRKFVIGVSLAIVLCMLPAVGGVAYAQEGISSAVYNAGTDTITISGVSTVRDDLGIAVADNAGVVVYVNQTSTDENGNYTIALQLNESGDAVGLKARVQKSTGGFFEQAIIAAGTPWAKATLAGDIVTVEFDVFDFVDVRELSKLSMIAALYKGGALAGITLEPLDIEQDTVTRPTLHVKGEPDMVRLFLLENMSNLIPLGTVRPFTDFE